MTSDRDRFAAAALTGLLSQCAAEDREPADAATAAWQYADAMLRERGNHPEKPDSSTNLDAAPAARAPADSHAPRGAVDRESIGTDKAEPLTRDCGTGEISEAQIDALECVVEDGRIVGMSVYGHLRSLLVKLRPEWGEEESDRPKPISEARLAALEELSALDQKLELEYGIAGNPMIKARRNTQDQRRRREGEP